MRYPSKKGNSRITEHNNIHNKKSIEWKPVLFTFCILGLVELWNPLPANVSLIDNVDILVSPEHASHVKKYLECSGLSPETVIRDLQKEIDQENVPSEESEDDGLAGRPGYNLEFFKILLRRCITI